jgi:hypothetical protein
MKSLQAEVTSSDFNDWKLSTSTPDLNHLYVVTVPICQACVGIMHDCSPGLCRPYIKGVVLHDGQARFRANDRNGKQPLILTTHTAALLRLATARHPSAPSVPKLLARFELTPSSSYSSALTTMPGGRVSRRPMPSKVCKTFHYRALSVRQNGLLLLMKLMLSCVCRRCAM